MAKVSFRTNALLKNIIGKDLITDDNLAVLELVKNSFDAGSHEVDIIFENLLSNDDEEVFKPKKDEKNWTPVPTNRSSKLVIKDEGIGMSAYDIEHKWLNIAFSEKKDKKEEYGRIMAGNKGVGRFSCDRLGRFLTIYSKSEKETEYNKIFIDWSKFENNSDIDFNIQDVEFEIVSISKNDFEKESGFKPFKSGTILKIFCLRETWYKEKIIGLKRQLERLINPNQAFKSGEFIIRISAEDYLLDDSKAEDYNKVNGIVQNKIFEKLNFRTTSIRSVLDKRGEYITTTLQDRGNEIFTLKEKNPYSQLSNIEITIFYLNTYSKAYFTKQTGIKAVDFGSIFLFLNGFRVPPYGDVGDDWLGMEIRKGQGYNRFLGTREVVGRIEVFDDNDKFKIISNRSGIVNNVAFNQLTKSVTPYGYYFKTFRRLERFVVEGIKWDSSAKDSAEIEKEISQKEWSPEKEEYNEDEFTRNKRLLSVINKIIDSKNSDVIGLTINEYFVNELIQEERNKSLAQVEEIKKIISQKSSELDVKVYQDLLKTINSKMGDIDELSGIIANYNDSKVSSELASLNIIQDFFKTSYQDISKAKSDLEEQLKKAKEEKDKSEEERKKLEEELELEKQKNTYLLTSKRTLSEDAKGLLHNVKQTSKKSKQNAETLYKSFVDDSVKKQQALKLLSTIIYNSDKALKISNLITRANFKANSDYQDVNLVKFIEQYLDLYNLMYEDSLIEFCFESKIDSFWKRISILDISLVFDDLISNSMKADAKKISVLLKNDSAENLVILFSDDGHGLSKRFVDNSSVIFDLGVTTTDGSGIGLNSVANTLLKMQGIIKFVGNGEVLKGASFQITISKSYK